MIVHIGGNRVSVQVQSSGIARASKAVRDAVDAQEAAKSARDEAVIARTGAETAQGLAENARDEATTQAGIATTKAGEASDDADAAATAQTWAETARAAAEDARDDAEGYAASLETAFESLRADTGRQRIGRPVAPTVGSATGSSTRVFADAAAHDSILQEIQLWGATSGTVKIKVYPKTGSNTYGAATSNVSVSVVGALNTLTPNDFGSISVPSGSVVALYGPTVLAQTAEAEDGLGVQSLTGDNTAGGTATDNTARWQVAITLAYEEQYVTAENVLAIDNGVGGYATITTSGLASSEASRALVTNRVAGEVMAQRAGGAWREPGGSVLSNSLGPCSVSGVKLAFDARDVVSKAGLAQSWPSQVGNRTLNVTGALPPIDRRGVLTFTSREALLLSAGVGDQTATLLQTIDLPSGALAEPPSGGFTITGLTRDAASGEWIAANFGKVVDADAFTPSIVIMRPSITGAIVSEIALAPLYPGLGGIQGVALDTSDDTIWFVDVDGKKIRHMTRAGVVISGDEIDLSSFTTPNALAYSPSDDALWVSDQGVATAYLKSCTDGSTVATMNCRSDADHFWWDDVNRYLYASFGSNGSNGGAEVRDARNGRVVTTITLPGSQAMEGIWVEGDKLYAANDQAFHASSNPALKLNVVNTYSFTPPPAADATSKLTLGVVMRQTLVTTPAQVIVSEGEPLSTVNGWALYLINTNGIRFNAWMAGAATATQVDWTVSGLLGDAWKTIVVKIDRVAGTAVLRVGGVDYSGTVTTGSVTGIGQDFALSRLSIGAANGSAPRNLKNGELSQVVIGHDMSASALETDLNARSLGLPR